MLCLLLALFDFDTCELLKAFDMAARQISEQMLECNSSNQACSATCPPRHQASVQCNSAAVMRLISSNLLPHKLCPDPHHLPLGRDSCTYMSNQKQLALILEWVIQDPYVQACHCTRHRSGATSPHTWHLLPRPCHPLPHLLQLLPHQGWPLRHGRPSPYEQHRPRLPHGLRDPLRPGACCAWSPSPSVVGSCGWSYQAKHG